MADTNLSGAVRPSKGGYSWHGVVSGLGSVTPSAILSPELSTVNAIYVQVHGASGWVGLSLDQVTTTNSGRELLPGSSLVEVWRQSPTAGATGSLTFYLLATAVGSPECSIRIEWI